MSYSLNHKTKTADNAILTAKKPILKPGEHRSIRKSNVLFELKKINLNLFHIFSSLFQTFLSFVYLRNYFSY